MPIINKHLPINLKSLQYYEPFVGAGAVFFNCQPRRAVISDYNSQLILAYEVVRKNIDDLIAALKAHSSENSEEYYYHVRGQDRDKEAFALLSSVQKVARLIYLNKTCYNGLYRVNSQGMFNVPYGRYANPSICDEPTLRAIHRYLNQDGAKIEIRNDDFEIAVETAGSGSFIYFDPPYHSPDNTSFTQYQAGGFGEEEQRRLRNVFLARTSAGSKCLLSSSDTSFIREIYTDSRFEIIALKAKRGINSNSAGRSEVNEVLIKNWH
jgi:DNA adenine methylase